MNTPSATALPKNWAKGPVLQDSARHHARLSPSTLKSKAICVGFRNDPDSDKTLADRGSFGHECVQHETPERVVNDPALLNGVKVCIDYKHRIQEKHFKNNWDLGKVETHQEVKLHYFDQWGFTDVVILSGADADILDWKFALNFHAADSPQFWAYAVGVWNKWPQIETINVHTVHPFRDEIDLETWTRAGDYERLSGQLAAIIRRVEINDPASYQVSSQCQWCGFAGRCVKLARLGQEIAGRYTAETDFSLPLGTLHGSEIVDPDVFSGLLRIAPAVLKAAGGWKKAALQMWVEGTPIPGYELAETSGRRSISSAKAAYEIVKDRLTPEQFFDACKVSPVELDELWKATFKRGEKAQGLQTLQDLLTDEELLSYGAESRHLRPIRA